MENQKIEIKSHEEVTKLLDENRRNLSKVAKLDSGKLKDFKAAEKTYSEVPITNKLHARLEYEQELERIKHNQIKVKSKSIDDELEF